MAALSPALVEALKKAAGGRNIELFLAELLAQRLDPRERVEMYLKLSEDYLREAEELYAKGDLPQAGEKYWGAVAALLNAVGEALGLEHYSGRDYQLVIQRIYRDTRDVEVLRLFGMAERLHANFYHNFLDKETFDRPREDALALIEKLRRYLDAFLR